MFELTDTEQSPWWVVDGDDKLTARLNLISHLLSVVPYEHLDAERIKLPKRQKRDYKRPPIDQQRFVPVRYAVKPD